LIISNYRPNSILLYLAKLFESSVCSYIKRSLNHILVNYQHGYNPVKSTIISIFSFTLKNCRNPQRLKSSRLCNVYPLILKKAYDIIHTFSIYNPLFLISFNYQIKSIDSYRCYFQYFHHTIYYDI